LAYFQALHNSTSLFLALACIFLVMDNTHIIKHAFIVHHVFNNFVVKLSLMKFVYENVVAFVCVSEHLGF
jgi:hypothetical protein